MKAVVTVSDGFIATGEAHARLFGYNATFLLVEEMGEEGGSEPSTGSIGSLRAAKPTTTS